MDDTFKCLSCGQENKKKRNTANKYCNNKCQHDYQHKLVIDKWKQGDYKSTQHNKHLKRYLLEQREGCYECGITEHNSKPITLELDHLDGNWTNNKEENLRMLCPNCHSQTPTYKNRNRGNGRTHRKNA